MASLLQFFRQNRGILLAVITLLFLLPCALINGFAEIVYRNFIFQGVRIVFDYTIGLLPFPFVYVLLPSIPFIVYFYIKRFEINWSAIWRVPLNLLGWIFGLFMWLWGFNYCCKPVKDLASIPPLNKSELFEFGKEVAQELATDQSDFLNLTYNSQDLPSLSDTLKYYIEKSNIVVAGNPHFYTTGLNGVMRRLGIAGIYLPFTAQCHGDDSFLTQAQYFTACHELSHGYGISSEAEADYFAYATLKGTNNPTSVYPALADIELLRSIRGQLHFMDDSLRIALDSLCDDRTLILLQRIRENAKLYPEYFPGMQHKMNDRYLRLMGIEDGIKNYDRFIDLAFYYRNESSRN